MRTKPKNLICFSHLRWNFVYQRPQHIIKRLSEKFNTIYAEEPIFDAVAESYYCFTQINESLFVLVPHLRSDLSEEQKIGQLKVMLRNILKADNGDDVIFWYYTPMAMEFSDSFSPALTIYDCMDELSAFKFAPHALQQLEKDLMRKADLVFTGGHTLYQEKKKFHSDIYPFPSSIDKAHFHKARIKDISPEDQENIKGVRLGFFGVIDERFDIELIDQMAQLKPDWQFILIGPIVKIEVDSLPRLDNIHYMGQKTYDQLPAYLSGWDIALIPFLLNESTKYISPTKTPEYLAAGIPVISTPITDVVNPYGIEGLVSICGNAGEFVAAAEIELEEKDKAYWLAEVDKFLKDMSWDNTTGDMLRLIESKLIENDTF